MHRIVFHGSADAQISLGNILKNVVSGGSSEKTTTETTSSDNSGVGGLLSSLTSIFSSTRWLQRINHRHMVYEEPAVVLSSDDMLKNIGGKVASSAVETQLKSKLEGYGFKKGSVTMTFDKSGNFTQTLMGKKVTGTYTIEDKNIVLKYGGKISQIVGTTQLDGDNLLIVMNASKLLEYVNVLGSVSQNSTLKTAASLIGGMDGLECGLKLVKQ